MRICLLSPNLPPMAWPCGAAHFVARYAQELAAQGVEVTLVTSNAAARPVPAAELVIEAGNWRLGHMRRLVEAVVACRAELVDFQYEAAMFSGSCWPMAWPYLLAGRGVRRVLTVHSQDLPRPGGRLWRPIQLLPYDGVFFYADGFRERMRRRWSSRAARFGLRGFPANITRAGSPQALAMIAKLRAFDHVSSPLLVYFGHINAGRGIEDILEAVRRRPDLRLLLVSKFDAGVDDYHRRLLALCDAYELRARVTFSGELADEQVSILLQAADAVVLPFPDGASFKNGSLAAAITHAAPIVTTAGDLTEPTLRACSGIHFYPAGRVEALTAAIDAALADPESRAAVATLADHYSWSRYVEARLRFYAAVLDGRPVDADTGVKAEADVDCCHA